MMTTDRENGHNKSVCCYFLFFFRTYIGIDIGNRLLSGMETSQMLASCWIFVLCLTGTTTLLTVGRLYTHKSRFNWGGRARAGMTTPLKLLSWHSLSVQDYIKSSLCVSLLYRRGWMGRFRAGIHGDDGQRDGAYRTWRRSQLHRHQSRRTQSKLNFR